MRELTRYGLDGGTPAQLPPGSSFRLRHRGVLTISRASKSVRKTDWLASSRLLERFGTGEYFHALGRNHLGDTAFCRDRRDDSVWLCQDWRNRRRRRALIDFKLRHYLFARLFPADP